MLSEVKVEKSRRVTLNARSDAPGAAALRRGEGRPGIAESGSRMEGSRWAKLCGGKNGSSTPRSKRVSGKPRFSVLQVGKAKPNRLRDCRSSKGPILHASEMSKETPKQATPNAKEVKSKQAEDRVGRKDSRNDSPGIGVEGSEHMLCCRNTKKST